MDIDAVGEWLRSLQLRGNVEQYVQTFRDNGIDGECLMTLSEVCGESSMFVSM